MNIMIVMPRFGMGGIAKIGAFLSDIVVNGKNRCVCCSLVTDKSTVKINKEAKVISLNYAIDNQSEITFAEKLLDKIVLLYKLNRIIRDNRIDIIIALGLDIARIAYVAKGKKCKIIASERGNPYRYNKKQFKKYKLILKRANAVVFQTKEAQKAFYDYKILRKSYIIPNPAIRRNNNIRKEVILCRKHRIVYCGRLSPDKNLQLLIEAFCDLKKSDYELYIYGNGVEYSKLCGLIEKFKMQDKVKIITDCDDVFASEYDASMVVLTSDEEGMPNALIEALCEGIPCIATDCPPGGVRKLLKNGERGILVPIRDKKALRDAMQRFINNPELADEFGRRGMEVKRILSPDKISKRWNKVINIVGNNVKD